MNEKGAGIVPDRLITAERKGMMESGHVRREEQ